MRFSPGDTVVRRYIQYDGRLGWVLAVRVVSDDERGLLTWISPGCATVQRTTLDNKPIRYLSCNEKLFAPTTHALSSWRSAGVLMFSPPQAAHSVWWFFSEAAEFTGWYVNLETPGRRWQGGRDCVDQALDVWIEPDKSWRWKDEDEFDDYTGRYGYWDVTEAAQIRAEGERLIKTAAAQQFPFDGTWCDFTPDPSWTATQLPWWWDQVPDQSQAARPDITGNSSALACWVSTSRRLAARSGPRGAATELPPPRSVADLDVKGRLREDIGGGRPIFNPDNHRWMTCVRVWALSITRKDEHERETA